MNTQLAARTLIEMTWLVANKDTPIRVRKAAGRFAKIMYDLTKTDNEVIGQLHVNFDPETKVRNIARHIMKETGVK